MVAEPEQKGGATEARETKDFLIELNLPSPH